MFLDKALDEIGKKNKIVAGIDLANDYAQISYCRLDQSMPDTVSQVMGEEQYNIPVVLCRKDQRMTSGSWVKMHCKWQKKERETW